MVKSDVSSFEVNVKNWTSLLLVAPLSSPVAVIFITGPVLSNVQLNWVATEFPLPIASVKVFSATSIVVSPSWDGVKVAVYTSELVDKKLLKVPPLIVISSIEKLNVSSLEVNVKDKVLSLLVSPSLNSAAVIVMVGPTWSMSRLYVLA